jgi:hypothetical protein
VATGGHGGILGAAGHDGPPLLHYLPTARHTWRSEVNITRLPFEVSGVRREGSRIDTVPVAIKGTDGQLLDAAIPKVTITKDASYWDDDSTVNPEAEVDLVAMIGHMLKTAPLAGFVVEGAHSVREAGLACAAPADAASGPQRPSRRSRRARQHRRVCSAGQPPLHRWLEPDRDQGSASTDGLPDELRRPATGSRPR